MPAFKVHSPAIIFNHTEYGSRLLFQQGVTNPRDQLGKNGVTLHDWFSSLFYKTIRIETNLINETGKHENKKFILNRNSLIKYLGKDANTTDDDQTLINKLNASFWTSDLNQPTEDKDKTGQSKAGDEGLRHAGQYNKRLINNWSNAIQDYFKGSFLSWLYQKTIAGLSRLKIRFLFVRKENDILEAGEVLAKKRFHEAYENVPAYRTHLVNFKGRPVAESTLSQIPFTSKDNYIKPQQFNSDLHLHGKYPTNAKTDTSTGTTGKPTAWVRGEKELDTVKKTLRLAARIQFGRRNLTYINAFALGPWATGLTTYELMRETGSVFATGPDKDKILDELLRITRYEKHQLELAVNALTTTVANKNIIIQVIHDALQNVLRHRDLSLKEVIINRLNTLSNDQIIALNPLKSEILSIAEKLNKEKTQMVIAGYPPFLKDLASYAKEKGHNLTEFSIIGVVGGQGISEAMRDQLESNGFKKIFSSYGASDLDINLGVESDYEIMVRKAIERNPGLARELYGANKGLPMVFHYDPLNYHVECDAANDLLFTCTREDRSSPRIRYNLGDKGRIYASSDVQALLAKYGIFQRPKTNLPLMFVWGRDSTVVFNGANLAFTELERAITNSDPNDTILKKSFYTYEDVDGVEHLEIWLELNERVELPKPGAINDYAKTLISNLADMNQDFRYQLHHLDEGTALPVVRFFKRNHSPISEAGGHRKQVLIFQKGVNLPEGYVMPEDPTLCAGSDLKMSSELFAAKTAPQA